MEQKAPPLPTSLAMIADPSWLEGGSIETLLQQVSLPRELLYHFAHGCIHDATQWAKMHGMKVPQAAREAAVSLRLWLDGQLSTALWRQRSKETWAVMKALEEALQSDAEVLSFRATQLRQAHYQLLRASAWSGVEQAAEAVDMVARCAAEAMSVLAASKEHQGGHWRAVRTRQRYQLAALVLELLQEHRSTLLHILTLQAAKYQGAIARWQDTLQDALFEKGWCSRRVRGGE